MWRSSSQAVAAFMARQRPGPLPGKSYRVGDGPQLLLVGHRSYHADVSGRAFGVWFLFILAFVCHSVPVRAVLLKCQSYFSASIWSSLV